MIVSSSGFILAIRRIISARVGYTTGDDAAGCAIIDRLSHVSLSGRQASTMRGSISLTHSASPDGFIAAKKGRLSGHMLDKRLRAGMNEHIHRETTCDVGNPTEAELGLAIVAAMRVARKLLALFLFLFLAVLGI